MNSARDCWRVAIACAISTNYKVVYIFGGINKMSSYDWRHTLANGISGAFVSFSQKARTIFSPRSNGIWTENKNNVGITTRTIVLSARLILWQQQLLNLRLGQSRKESKNTHRHHNRNNTVQDGINFDWITIFEANITNTDDFMQIVFDSFTRFFFGYFGTLEF